MLGENGLRFRVNSAQVSGSDASWRYHSLTGMDAHDFPSCFSCRRWFKGTHRRRCAAPNRNCHTSDRSLSLGACLSDVEPMAIIAEQQEVFSSSSTAELPHHFHFQTIFGNETIALQKSGLVIRSWNRI